MSVQYDDYLGKHKGSVVEAYLWIEKNTPDIIQLIADEHCDLRHQICFGHDYSKRDLDEYSAYDAYFYGNNISFNVEESFKKAWLSHIHKNPHHWQHWILHNDDAEDGLEILDMPLNYILEMVCDWWSFSWGTGNLKEVFEWYDKHKDYILLSEYTRTITEHILNCIKSELDKTVKDEV